MAKKIDIDLVKVILHRNHLDIKKINDIVREIEEQTETNSAEEKLPVEKKQFVILVSDPNGFLEDRDLVGWVLQIPEEDSPMVAAERISRAAYDFNLTPVSRRLPIESISEACEAVPSRIFKEHHVYVKTKTPILVVTTDGTIPRK